MKYLGYDMADLKINQGLLTAREISNQPDLWLKTYYKFLEEKDNIANYLKKVLENNDVNIILTGAGSSAFIGETLKGIIQRKFGIITRAIPTTNIITHAEDIFINNGTTLLISFARSGDSPESVATIDLARKYCKNLYELNITCNSRGKLARKESTGNSYVFVLPEESNDMALAMTGSYTSMLLAGIFISDLANIEKSLSYVQEMRFYGKLILGEYRQKLWELAQRNIDRAVFLGSGPLLGVAQESHLKVQELTSGRVICKFDSFLGFRHGPKAVIDSSTIVFYLLSNDRYVQQYERDLIKSLKDTVQGTTFVCIGSEAKCPKDSAEEITITIFEKSNSLPLDYLSVLYVLPSQLFGFYKSLQLKLFPDFPSKNRIITRVVEGVKIYPRPSTG